MTEYPLMKLNDIKKYLQEAIDLKVSQISRTKGWFFHYNKNKGKQTEEWSKRRILFIKRTLPAYEMNPTHRRWLSLIMWGYYVEPQHKLPKEF